MKKTNRIAVAILALALPIAALADLSGTQTLATNTALNLDTGAIASSGGDLLWSGSSITPQGKAKAANIGNVGAAAFASLPLSTTQTLASATGTSAPILSATLVVGDVFVAVTNGGNYAKVLVTANGGGSITLQFTTFGVSGGGGGGPTAPTITDVQNNSSLIPDGFPNSGVAASTLIVIHGSKMADPNAQAVLQDSTKGIPTTLNGASAKVTSGGKDYPLGLYYAIASQIAAVLPAAVPTGSATLTVSYNGQSASLTITVVASAFGIDVYDGNLAVVQDSISGALVDYTHSGKPGQIVTVWGSGLGSNPADSDTTYTSSPHTIGTAVKVYLGGVRVNDVRYSGASVYPGVHILVFTIPQGVPDGCFNPLIIVTGSGNPVDSNGPAMPVMSNGGVCTDPYTGYTGSQIGSILTQTNVKSGTVFVGQSTGPAPTGGGLQTSDIAFASFQQATASGYASGLGSTGACTINQVFTSTGTSTSTGLDAGTVTVTPPAGGPVTLQSLPTLVGTYLAQLASGAVTAGGSFAFHGTGGSGANRVGSFDTTVTFPGALINWTNQSASATVTRSAGQTYTWTGGAPGTFVIMVGSSSSNSVSGSYTCIAPAEAGQFTVPDYILFGLPAGKGSSLLENSTKINTFTAGGLDIGYGIGFVSTMANSTYQ